MRGTDSSVTVGGEEHRTGRRSRRNPEANYCCSITSNKKEWTQANMVRLPHGSQGITALVKVISGKATVVKWFGWIPTFKTKLKPVTYWINKPSTFSQGAVADEWEVITTKQDKGNKQLKLPNMWTRTEITLTAQIYTLYLQLCAVLVHPYISAHILSKTNQPYFHV